MMCVTSVDPYWLGESAQHRRPAKSIADGAAELGGVFFSIREKNFDALARARANRDFSKRTELETEMARQREECVQRPPGAHRRELTSSIERAKAEQIQQEATGRTPRIGGVASTPRSVRAGIGAGARTSATPRRRGGGI
jgi:pre-mRNA-splicing factor ATP-dependent RNA helicase DHX38/PRP16